MGINKSVCLFVPLGICLGPLAADAFVGSPSRVRLLGPIHHLEQASFPSSSSKTANFLQTNVNPSDATRLFMSTKAAATKRTGRKRLATAMAFLTGWANLTIFTKFKTFASMMTGNSMWMAVALTEKNFVDVAYYLSVLAAYLFGTALFRRTDLSYRKQTLPVCAAMTAGLFVLGDLIHYKYLVGSRWIPMLLFSTAFGITNSLGMEVTGTLNFVITGHYTKLINTLVDRVSRTAGRKRLSEAQRSVVAQNAAIIGGFFGGAVFASILMGCKLLDRFGIFSAIGLIHAVLWMIHDMEALGGAWWLRKEGAMCDITDDGELCDLPEEKEGKEINGKSTVGTAAAGAVPVTGSTS